MASTSCRASVLRSRVCGACFRGGMEQLPPRRLPAGRQDTRGPNSSFARPALAATWERICREAIGATREARIDAARDAWYRGFVAEAVDRFCRSTDVLDVSGRHHRGLLTADDLRALVGDGGGSSRLRLRRPYRAEMRPLEPGPGVPAAARPAGRLRHRRDGSGLAPSSCTPWWNAPSFAYARSRRLGYGDPEFRQHPAGHFAVRRLQRRRAASGGRSCVYGIAARRDRGPDAVGGSRRGPTRGDVVPGAGAGEPHRRAARCDWCRHLPASTSSTSTATWSAPRHQVVGCNPLRWIPELGFCLGTRGADVLAAGRLAE